MYSSLLVADYLLAHGDGSLTPLHVLKLTYFSHGYTLAIKDKPLIADKVEAWKYGPVIPLLYHYVRSFGDRPVDILPYSRITLFGDAMDEHMRFLDRTLEPNRNILDKVLSEFGNRTASEIIKISHGKGSAWEQCYESNRRRQIPTHLTKQYFKELVSCA